MHRDGTATITLKDIKSLDIEQQRLIQFKFDKIMRKKGHQQNARIKGQLAKRTKDGLKQYRYLLQRADFMIAGIKNNSKLSIFQKKDKLKELKIIRKQLLGNYDIKEIERASQIAKSIEGEKLFKELHEVTERINNNNFYTYEKSKTLSYLVQEVKNINLAKPNFMFVRTKK